MGVEAHADRLVVHVDRQKAARLGLSQKAVADTLATLLEGANIGYLHGGNVKYPLPIRLQAPERVLQMLAYFVGR